MQYPFKTPKARGYKKSPTSLTFVSEKSPQLQNNLSLNKYTAKNIRIGVYPNVYNSIAHHHLAYQRLARGSDSDNVAKVRLGPKIFRIDKKNYKKLKKGQKVYLDRESVVYRGPFIFQRLTRGPRLNFTAKDIGYDQTYNFFISLENLEKNPLYAIIGSNRTHTRKGKKRHTRRRTKRHTKRHTRRRTKRRR